MRNRVAEAVLSLKEPYRSTILLRFYEDHSTCSIAESGEISTSTVRSRLKRGLEQLKQHLDEEFGDRSSWCLALAPIAGLKVGAQVATAGVAASTVSTVSGGLIMATKVKVAISAVLVLAAALVVWQIIPKNSEIPDLNAIGSVTDEKRLSRQEEESPPLVDGEGGEIVIDSEERVTKEPIFPTGISFSGQVIDMVSGDPITFYGFHLWQKSRDGEGVTSGPNYSINEVVRDPEGRFNFPLNGGGKIQIQIRSPSHLNKIDEIVISNTNGLADVQYRLDPSMVVSGIALDAETREPVADAIVGSRLKTHLFYIHIINLPTYTKHSVTDTEGRFRLGGLDFTRQRIVATHPNYAEGHVMLNPDENKEQVILLKRGFRITGSVHDKNGDPAEGIVVEISGSEIPLPRPFLTRVDGTYRSPPVLPGQVTVSASEQSGEETGSFSAETKFVEIVDRDVKVDFGLVDNYVTWRGIAYDFDGSPVPNLEISLEVEELFQRREARDRRNLTFSCDRDGAFEIEKLYPGTYFSKLEFPGRTSIVEWGQVTFEENGLVQKNIHITGTVINGKLIDGGTGELLTGSRGYVYVRGRKSDGSRRRFSAWVNGTGLFRIRGIPPGDYAIQADLSDRPTIEVPTPPIGLNEIIEDFELVIPVGGTLNLKIMDREKSTPGRFNLSIVHPNEIQRGREYRFDAEGRFNYTTQLEAGKWNLVLSFPGVGIEERIFTIAPGKETVLLMNSEEFAFFEGTVSVCGEVIDFNGAPVRDAKISFRGNPVEIPSLNNPYIVIEAETDEDGRFEVGGFIPGRWDVDVQLSRSMRRTFPAIWIPALPTNPFPFKLVIAQGGTVQGYLVEKKTGLGLTKDGSWRGSCSLLSVARRGTTCQSEIQAGGRFEFTRVPEGSYRLKIDAFDFGEVRLESFSLGEGQVLDLGEISLSPAGRIALEVLNQNDEFVSQVKVKIWNDEGFLKKTGAGIPCSLRGLPIAMLVKRTADRDGYNWS